MSSDWPLVKLENVTTKIGSGATPRGGKESYKDSGISLIRSLNVYDLQFDRNQLAFIDEIQASQLSNVEIKPKDVLLNITGASVARCCMVPNDVLPARVNQHVSIIRANQEIADSRYILYCLVSPQYKHHLLTLAQGGATREALTKETISNFEIPFPPLDVQRKIAAVLSTYDNLIENNTRRIAILEEMAQALYREWFVHFRFPGHEDVKMVEVDGGNGNGRNGRVPEGWEILPIGNAVETLGGGTPSKRKDEYWEDGDIVWYVPSDLTQAGTMFMLDSRSHINELGLKKSSAKMFPAYSVMMTSRATIGVTAINTTSACTNQGFITCVPTSRISAYQLYFWIQENLDIINNYASGATFKEINKTNFRKIPITITDNKTHKRFVEIVEPIAMQILNLQKKNANLRQTRDLLLPRLISGELDVSHIPVAEVSLPRSPHTTNTR